MSLDFVVLDDEGAPDRVLFMGIDLHYELISTASRLGLSHFDCFSDYYEDGVIDEAGLRQFEQQVQLFRDRARSPELLNFLSELCDLTNYATSKGKSLHAVAD